MHLPTGRRIAVALAGVAVVSGSTLAFATIPHSTTRVISGCYANTTGALRVIDKQAGVRCASGQTLIEWNQQGMRWRGAWSSTLTYLANDAVSYNGSAYIAKASVAAGTLPTTTAKWDVLAQKGATGATGAAGLTGGRSADGPGGNVPNCAESPVATQTITITKATRLNVGFEVVYFGDDNNFGQAGAKAVLKDSAGTTISTLPDLSIGSAPANTFGEMSTEGVLTGSAGAPLTLAAGSYTLSALLYPYGYCAGQTYVNGARLTYLKLGNAD